jgi:tetratricopeptide (TPR) repeat protein
MRFSVVLVGWITFLALAIPVSLSRAAVDDAATCANSSGDEAIASCTRAIKSGHLRGADLAEAYAHRGVAYRSKGDNDRGLADYNEAIRLDPKPVWVYFNRGNVYLKKGDNDHAIADYSKAIQLDPNGKQACTPCAFNGRGLAYRSKGDNDRAIADFSEAIRLDPKLVKAYNNRGDAYLSKGDNDRANSDYDQAIKLNPNHTDAINSRARALAKKGGTIVGHNQRSVALLAPKGLDAVR